MESNNSIEELIIRYLQNEIQEDELRVLDAWIHESDANKAHFFELKGLFDTRKEVAFLNHYSVERSWERMAGKLDAISGVSVKSKVLGKQFWLSFLRYAAIIVIAMGVGVGMNQWISNRLYAGDMEYNEIVVEKGGRANTLLLSDGSKIILNASTRFTDGFEFGFGAEIGISTQKLHARGPMGLLALTSTKYIIYGNGQIRP